MWLIIDGLYHQLWFGWVSSDVRPRRKQFY